MKSVISNPFVTGGYISPKFFCNRAEETKRITDAIASRRNLTIISLRRIGKTGLLKHIKYLFEHSKRQYAVIYADLLPTMDGNDMLNVIASALLKIRKGEKNFLEKALGILASLRPRLSIDPLTGEPSIDLRIDTSSGMQSGLEQILNLIPEIKKDIVFMFDEFQQIVNYPEKNIEAILRSVIQSYPAIPFIFSGSSKHMLENMFASPGKPFYQSSELMYLDMIREDDYRIFISDNFSRNNRGIDDKAIDRIFEWTRLHTYYVQFVCNQLYEKGQNRISEAQAKRIFLQIISDFEPQYINYRNLLPAHQFQLLRAIAAENGIKQPTSGSFISKHNLTSPSSVATSLKALSEKEMVVYDSNKWIVYDIFFSRWLEYHYRE